MDAEDFLLSSYHYIDCSSPKSLEKISMYPNTQTQYLLATLILQRSDAL
jgi:hypothetical protein